MKLYNLFQEVILEEIERHRGLITESVSFDEVKAAIDGRYNVNILYRDYEGQSPSKRYIQVYALGKTKSGNDAIRAYQIIGASKRGNKNGYWKIFRLDRIEGWFPTKMKWNKPISDVDPSLPKYNQNGDKTFSNVSYQAKFNQPQQTPQQTT
jgi:hypothetical protein